mgnify:FL=1|jgi:hypothetical protein
MTSKFFARPISSKEDIKIRSQEKIEIEYRRNNFTSSFRGAPLASFDLGIIYIAKVYRSLEINSEEYDLKYSFQWPCTILLHASEDINFPLSALSYSGDVTLLYFPWILKKKIISSFIEADNRIDEWRTSRSFFQIWLGGMHPEFNSNVTQECINRVKSILS